MVHDGNLEKQIEKHIGCMTGFLQIFDPLPGRQRRLRLLRRSTPRRLPGPTPPSDGGSGCSSPTVSEEITQGKVLSSGGEIRSPAPESETEPLSVTSTPKTPTVPFPVFEFKEGGRLPWKFSKEAPRLSLDSRAVTDARGGLYPREIRTANHTEGLKDEAVGGVGDMDGQRRSPSVIARLMGLENLPSSDPNNLPSKMQLRRSASDSRVSKEIYRFIEGGNYSCGSMVSVVPVARLPIKESGVGTKTNARRELEKSVAMQLQKGSVQRKSYYDTSDFFPDSNRSTQAVPLYEVIGKKLRARGINEPSKDLESLMQILEASQLKGLLHCKAGNGIGGLQSRRKKFDSEESPIVLKHPRSYSGRKRSESQSPSRSPIRGRANSQNGRRQPEDRKRAGSRDGSNCSEQGRMLTARSPRTIVARKAAPNHNTTYRTYQGGKFAEEKVITIPTAEDEASTVSESSISTPSSQTDTEKSKLAEGYEEGKGLLERCDKLLNSIAEITAAAAELQPSPVSVLDRSLYDEFEGPSMSPRMMKRGLGLQFKDHSAESADEDAWSPVIHLVPAEFDHNADDCDFAYVSDVVGASNYLPGDPDLFELLEKRWYIRGKDASSRLCRKLTFDTVLEILDQRRLSLRWKHSPWTVPELEKPDLGQIWLDYRKIRQSDSPSPWEDILESVRKIPRKDLTGNVTDSRVTSESAVDIERLIFKDLISETIRDLPIPIASSDYNDNNQYGSRPGPRRKLAF